MFAHWPLLSLVIWTPIVGGFLLLLTCRADQPDRARVFALVVTLITIFFSVLLWHGFNTHTVAMQFTEHVAWIPAFHLNYDLGVDGISMPLIVLTNYTTLMVVLASWQTIRTRVPQFMATFLIMQGMVNGVFGSLDAILFYAFWEGMLIPMYMSIGIWGSSNRSYAAIKFFIYTFFGSALLLVALLYLGFMAKSFYIPNFFDLPLTHTEDILVFLAFLLAFAVKVPMWPLHTWLPDAHTEAPAGGSVVLAALMLKIGSYGFLRFSLPITPYASHALDWVMITLSLIAIVYVGIVAIAQTDMKKLIAYSSIAHMGFVTLGCFMIYVIIQSTGNHHDAYLALDGSIVQMISHAFGTGAMFIAFGLLYDRMRTRKIANFGGITKTMPIFAAFFMLYSLSNVGLPGTSGFVGEFMVILSTFKANFWVTVLAASTLVIGPAYTLWMYKRVFFGPIVRPEVSELKDIGALDITLFVLLALPILVIGLYPEFLLNVFHTTIGHLLTLSTTYR